MIIENNKQISLTDEYYDKEIKLEELFKALRKEGRNIHFSRTSVTVALEQYRHSEKTYKLLLDSQLTLTLSLSWLGDALYTISKELPKGKNDGDYWKLRDMTNYPSRTGEINLGKLNRSVLNSRKGLFRLLDKYHSYIMETSVLMSIFEAMIEEVRNSVKILDKIKFYEY